MVYVSKWDVCPVGCGMGVVFLKSLDSRRIFLHCTACGLAWGERPAPNLVDALDEPEVFAPRGISLPTRREIEAAGLATDIDAEYPDDAYHDRLWRLWARTYIAAGESEQAVQLLNQVINNWHSPPALAYQLRATAYRAQGDLARAEEDQRKADQFLR
jgi:tetratricopeptide (TPR) repeat protein